MEKEKKNKLYGQYDTKNAIRVQHLYPYSMIAILSSHYFIDVKITHE